VLLVFLVFDINLTPGSVINTPSDLAKCFPTCTDNDGRFLVLAGSGQDTLAGQDIDLQFVVEDGVSDFNIYIFDGDTNKFDPNDPSATWDVGYPNTTPVIYSVFADPDGDGGEEGGSALVSDSSDNMSNNNWHTINVPVDPGAQGSDGRYYFQLHLELSNPTAVVSNMFKVGTNDDAELYTIPEKPFAFQAALNSYYDVQVIYEGTANIPQQSYSSTTYDGTFTFYFQVPDGVEEIYMADGDMDRSDPALTDLDTDDFNTPPTEGEIGPQFPLFVSELGSTSVVPEGVAVGTGGGTGSPNDDTTVNNLYLRSGEISYVVSNPNGNKNWANNDPSGNREWEVFLISTIQDTPDADYHETGTLNGGVFKVVISGMDMNNLNAWYFAYSICAVDVDGNPTCGEEEGGDFQGCTPGYWRQERQHGWAWDPDDSGDTYLFEDSFETIFGLSGTELGSAFTLLDAVNNTGDGAGPGQLSRHATAALLNINNDGVNYPIDTAELISLVQAAFAAEEYENLKNVLDGYNNLGCPLGNDPN
jgi:hypothetical protein